MNKRLIILSAFFALLTLLLTIYFYKEIRDVSVPFFELSEIKNNNTKNGESVYIGVISRYPPNVILKGYQPIMDYLNSVTPYHYELKLSTNYEQTLNQLVEGKVTAAFFGSLLYVRSSEKYRITPILKPLNENLEPFFRSVLVTSFRSNINSINDIKGKRLALPSPESFSGNWLLFNVFPKYQIKVSDLSAIQNFAHHHSVVYQVLKGNYDVGVVRDYLAKQYMDRGLKIIAESEPIPGSPIVISEHSNPEYVQALSEALLSLDINKQSNREMMNTWDKEFIHGFVKAKDSDYEYIRKTSERSLK